MAFGFEASRQLGEVSRDPSGDLRRVLGWIEALRLLEDCAEGIDVLGEICEEQARSSRIGERAVIEGAVKGRVKIEAVPDVAHDDERRRIVERPGVLERLPERFLHRV